MEYPIQNITHSLKTKVIVFRKDLPGLKDQAHKYFDMLWKLKYIERNEAYYRLSEWMDLTKSDTHISMFNHKQCQDVITYSIMILNDFRRLDIDFGVEPKHKYFEIQP